MNEASARLKAEVAQPAGSFSQLVVVNQKHATFTGRHQLVGIKAEATRGTEAADTAAAVLGTMRFGSIFDDLESIFFG